MNAILTQVVAAMRAGKAITVTPQAQSLTTQQAADLLGVSRPTLIKLIEAGELPCTRLSNRRMLLLDDVIAYRAKRRDQQLAAIAATQADMDDESDPETMKRLLAEARAARIARNHKK
ncbi:MAG TPA: helix-turn-helix domain-containing protein [Candidatus Dietzia intestinigallinarum]|nr:helix-turn-helix domain-containing protein [Candidatus Dietzia intestinigallinarum]